MIGDVTRWPSVFCDKTWEVGPISSDDPPLNMLLGLWRMFIDWVKSLLTGSRQDREKDGLSDYDSRAAVGEDVATSSDDADDTLPRGKDELTGTSDCNSQDMDDTPSLEEGTSDCNSQATVGEDVATSSDDADDTLLREGKDELTGMSDCNSQDVDDTPPLEEGTSDYNSQAAVGEDVATSSDDADDTLPCGEDVIQNVFQELNKFTCSGGRAGSSYVQQSEKARRKDEDQCDSAVTQAVKYLRVLIKKGKQSESVAVKQLPVSVAAKELLSWPVSGGQKITKEAWFLWVLLVNEVSMVSDETFRDRLMESCVRATGPVDVTELDEIKKHMTLAVFDLWNRATYRVCLHRGIVEDVLSCITCLSANDREQILYHLDERECLEDQFQLWLSSPAGKTLCDTVAGGFSRCAKEVKDGVSYTVMKRIKAIEQNAFLACALSLNEWKCLEDQFQLWLSSPAGKILCDTVASDFSQRAKEIEAEVPDTIIKGFKAVRIKAIEQIALA